MYHIEKETGDIVIDGFEKGIASSPYLGIGDMKCINISTELTEASVNYSRTQLNQSPISGGTMLQVGTATLQYSGVIPLVVGSWINITNAGTTGLSTGLYFIANQTSGSPTAGNFNIGTDYRHSQVVSGINSGTITFSTIDPFVKIVAATKDLQTPAGSNGIVPPTYFMMDIDGVILFYNATYNATFAANTPNNWIQLTATGPSTGNATGMEVLDGYIFRFYTSTSTGLPVVDYASIALILASNFQAFAPLGNLISTNIHPALSGHDNTLYYCDGHYISSIAPAFSPVSGFWAYDGSTADMVLTITSGTSLAVGQPVQLSSTGTFPSGGQFSPNITYYVISVTSLPSVGSTGTAQTLTATGTISSGATSATLTAMWPYATQTETVTFSDTEQRSVLFTSGSALVTWSGALSNNVSARLFVGGQTQTFELSATQGGAALTATGTITGILTLQSVYFNPGIAGSYTWNQFALQLPDWETAQCLAELGTNLMIGGATNNLYPWDRASTTATTTTTSSFFYPILLPENNIVQMVTVNNYLYIFCGSKGNIYLTSGGVANLAMTIPDYVTGLIEPSYVWGGTMYARGRVWFSVSANNCGGVWSFVPTLNQIALGQDVGIQLHLENQNSYGTYSGYASVLLPNQNQAARGVQYWSGWFDGTSTYGIDGSATTPYATAPTGSPPLGPVIIETDAIPTGTILGKQQKSFGSLEYKLSTALVSGESVKINYRQDIGAAWQTCGTLETEPTSTTSPSVAGVIQSLPFQNTQWLQLQILQTSTVSNPSFNRLKEIRIHLA